MRGSAEQRRCEAVRCEVWCGAWGRRAIKRVRGAAEKWQPAVMQQRKGSALKAVSAGKRR